MKNKPKRKYSWRFTLLVLIIAAVALLFLANTLFHAPMSIEQTYATMTARWPG